MATLQLKDRKRLILPVLAAVLIFSLLAHISFSQQNRLGFVWLAAAGLLLAIIAPPLPAIQYDVAHALNLSSNRRRWWGMALLVIGAVLLLDAARIFYTNWSQNNFRGNEHWNRYVIGFALWVVAGVLLTHNRQPHRARLIAPLFALILFVAIIVRVANLGTMPGIWYDEAVNGLEARNILANVDYRPVFVNGVATLPHYVFYAPILKLFGETNIFAMRLTTVMLGVGAVVMAYLVGTQLRGHYFGLLLAFILAAMRWYINFSGFAMIGTDTTFFILLTFYFIVRLVRYGQVRDAILAGLAAGFGLWFYRGFQMLLFGVVFYLLISWPRARPWKNTLLLGLTLAFTTLVVVLPLAVFILTSGEFFARTAQVTIFNPDFHDMPRDQAILYNLGRHLEMFHLFGDRNGRHNLPREPILDPVTGILFGLGLVVALREGRRSDNGFFFAVLILGMTTAILTLTFEAPQSFRSLGAVSAVAYFAAVGGFALGRSGWAAVQTLRINRFHETALPAVRVAAIVGLGLALAGLNAYVLFARQRTNYRVWIEFSTIETRVGEMLAQQDDDTRLFASPFLGRHPSMLFLAHEQTSRLEVLEMPDFLPLSIPPTNQTTLFLVPLERVLFEYAKTLYPNGRFRAVSSADYGVTPPSSSSILFYIIELTPEDIAAIQGLEPDGSGIFAAPAYGEYRFSVTNGGRLTLDGQSVSQDAAVVVARGIHEIRLDPPDAMLEWMPPGTTEFEPVQEWRLFHRPVELHGLHARYYANADWEGEPVMERIHPLVYQQIHIIPMPRPYSVIWTGQLYAPGSGEYQFALTAIDYARLSLDGDIVLDTPEQNRRFIQPFYLTRGWHDIEVRHQDLTGSTRIFLEWSPPGSSGLVPVPVENLRPK